MLHFSCMHIASGLNPILHTNSLENSCLWQGIAVNSPIVYVNTWFEHNAHVHYWVVGHDGGEHWRFIIEEAAKVTVDYSFLDLSDILSKLYVRHILLFTNGLYIFRAWWLFRRIPYFGTVHDKIANCLSHPIQNVTISSHVRTNSW